MNKEMPLPTATQEGGMETYEVAYHKGTKTLHIGQQWRDQLTGSTWEIVEIDRSRMAYSPSGLGGTFCFWCKCVGGEHKWHEYAREDGAISMCGDSIAASLAIEEKLKAAGEL